MARHNSAMLFDFKLPTSLRKRLAFVACLLACALVASACNFPARLLTDTPAPLPTETPAPTLATAEPTDPPRVSVPYGDAGPVLAGVCFRFLQTLGSHTLLLDSTADLTQLYDAVDSSKQCRGTIARKPFDFSTRQIVGFVATGTGCDLDLLYDHTELDEQSKQRIVVFRSQVSGDCPYDLVHPVWLAVERQGYTTQIRVTAPS